MKYKVTFRQRFSAEGEASDAPEQLLDTPEDVILDAQFVERIESPAMHVEERMEEDDNWLAFGTSTWIYDVKEGKEQEFRDAVIASELVLHIEELADTPEYMT